MKALKSRKFEKLEMILYDNFIMEFKAFPNNLIEIEDTIEAREWVVSFSEGIKYCNLMIASDNVDLDPKLREYLASSDENKYTIADAFLISNPVHRMMTNFYMRFNKPAKPTKAFTNRDKAVQWLLSEKKTYNKKNSKEEVC